MIKSFLITLSFSTLLFSSQQIVLVVADDFNSSRATLTCYENEKVVCKDFKVNLGKNGLGWGIGIENIPHATNEPVKHEGDKKAPAGIFSLTDAFGYDYKFRTKLPYIHADTDTICVDDSNSPFYNQIIQAHGDEKSFEHMRRDDELYKTGVFVAHNPHAAAQRGSCIFLHIQRGDNIPTVGCTSMKEKDLKRIVMWLDKKKNPILIQIPKKYLNEVKRYYPALRNSQK
ncbi:L,D-transpeptidase family protein [Sulfurimonas paralvinellae]|uniref:L,D-transpeptidase family protein n=1 Tax=Sulfurimonas paralvinellae TaxID=317658 RepID=A0A7M1B5S1_9BACT|nr:L,D-transpeptidase family protein [Sulfurimonas paralvinellae]QOP45079.1 L,D-transpeptidase family protein [Sulfurimonas paralvinellae]